MAALLLRSRIIIGVVAIYASLLISGYEDLIMRSLLNMKNSFFSQAFFLTVCNTSFSKLTANAAHVALPSSTKEWKPESLKDKTNGERGLLLAGGQGGELLLFLERDRNCCFRKCHRKDWENLGFFSLMQGRLQEVCRGLLAASSAPGGPRDTQHPFCKTNYEDCQM